jgi:hypothetical protein
VWIILGQITAARVLNDMLEMSNVINLSNVHTQQPTDPALERLAAIRDILSALNVPNLRAPKQMLRALWMLDIANTNIQILLADFRAVPNQEQLVRQSEKLASLIELARERVARLGIDLGTGFGRDDLARRSADG